MRSVETEAASIDEAIQKALDTLRVERDQVEIDILDNATRGLFGLGARRARVRATVRPSLGSQVQAMDGGGSPLVRSSASRGNRAEAAARAREVLEVVLGHLVDSPRIEESSEGDGMGTIHISLGGADSGMVIGRRGQTLDALEHLVSRIVFREEADPALRITLDVEGYRERRQESLEQLARRLAAKARVTGLAVTMNPMSPRDRRVVHLELQNDPSVTTKSEGEGHYRRLVILPQGGRRGRERSPNR